jgi:FkbM family methyltransferase
MENRMPFEYPMNFLVEKLRNIDRRIRSALDFPTRSDSELQYRINRLPNATRAGATFRFPWGQLEYVSASDLRGQFWEIFIQRHYAFRCVATEPVIIDAGGNIGLSAIWFKRAYPKAQLTVYEADPELASLLARNLVSAGIADANVQNVAVWTQDGFVSFDNLGQDKGAVRQIGAIQVPSVDLAAHLPERVDLLKLDVEGAEYAIVSRLCSSGAIGRVQNLVAEFHVRRRDVDNFIQSLRFLREAGMELAMTSALGPWLGPADVAAPFEIVGDHQVLVELYAWR